MKRHFETASRIYIILIIALVILLVGGIMIFLFKKDVKSKSSKGILIINDEYTIADNVTIHYKKNASYSCLPLLEIFKYLGANIDWIDVDSANVTYKGKKYILDLREVSLVESGGKMNLIFSADGWRREYTILERELILDSVTIKCAFMFMGNTIDFSYDHEISTVYANESNNG